MRFLLLGLLFLISCGSSYKISYHVTCYSPSGEIVLDVETKQATFRYGILHYWDKKGITQKVNLDCKILETRVYEDMKTNHITTSMNRKDREAAFIQEKEDDDFDDLVVAAVILDII